MNWKKVGEKEIKEIPKKIIEFDEWYWSDFIWEKIDYDQKRRDYPWLFQRKK